MPVFNECSWNEHLVTDSFLFTDCKRDPVYCYYWRICRCFVIVDVFIAVLYSPCLCMKARPCSTWYVMFRTVDSGNNLSLKHAKQENLMIICKHCLKWESQLPLAYEVREKVVFLVCLSVQRGGGHPLSCHGPVYPGVGGSSFMVLSWRGGGCYHTVLSWSCPGDVTPDRTQYLLCRGWYASCSHTGGLSCCNGAPVPCTKASRKMWKSRLNSVVNGAQHRITSVKVLRPL